MTQLTVSKHWKK